VLLRATYLTAPPSPHPSASSTISPRSPPLSLRVSVRLMYGDFISSGGPCYDQNGRRATAFSVNLSFEPLTYCNYKRGKCRACRKREYRTQASGCRRCCCCCCYSLCSAHGRRESRQFDTSNILYEEEEDEDTKRFSQSFHCFFLLA